MKRANKSSTSTTFRSRKRPRGGDGNKPGAKAKGVSISNKIRGLKRALKRCGEDETEKRAALEKSLKEWQDKQTSKKKAEVFEKRYKGVKFIEQKKLNRRIAAARKKMGDCADAAERAVLANQISSWNDDVKYILAYPADQKYISIFAEDLAPEAKKKRRKFRERALKSAALEQRGTQRQKLLDMQSDRLQKAREENDKKISDDFFREA